jgi:hypothetical protein
MLTAAAINPPTAAMGRARGELSALIAVNPPRTVNARGRLAD